MKLNRTIKDLRGNPVKYSFPTQIELEKLPLGEDGKPDRSKLPDDTVRNIILNCLATYPTKDRREVFQIQAIAGAVMLDGEDLQLKESLHKLLVSVIYDQTFRDDEKGGRHGIYFSWMTAQVLDELGVKEPD